MTVDELKALEAGLIAGALEECTPGQRALAEVLIRVGVGLLIDIKRNADANEQLAATIKQWQADL